MGRLIFIQNALKLWQQCDEEMLDPTKFIERHDHITAFVTYPVRCLTTAEILSLLALSGAEAVQGDLKRLSELVDRFVANQPGTRVLRKISLRERRHDAAGAGTSGHSGE